MSKPYASFPLRGRKCTALSLVGFTATMCLVISGSLLAKPEPFKHDVSIATQLKQVQRATIDGRDYLTLHIGGHNVGPSSCRSNVLRMHTGGDAGAERQQEIETIAMSAMLTGATVMIEVPLDVEQCVDGKPTFTDLYRVVPSL